MHSHVLPKGHYVKADISYEAASVSVCVSLTYRCVIILTFMHLQ